MKSRVKLFAALALAACGAFTASAQLQDGVRTIKLNEDRDQKWMVSKVYELKNIGAEDITGWIQGAVQRYNNASNCQRLVYKTGKKQWIVVTTGRDMMLYVDQMVATMDRPCAKTDSTDPQAHPFDTSIVDGSGIYRFTYRPKFRANDAMITTVLRDCRSDGYGWWDPNNNLFYWKDSKSDGETVLKWMKAIDRPVPQVNVTLNVYEINENDFKELGVDWIAWKNGPGASLFGCGMDFTKWKSFQDMAMDDVGVNMISEGALGSMGGFMFAPQFDATFIRMLGEKGKAKVATSGNLTLVNNYSAADPWNATFDTGYDAAAMKLRFNPNYQVIEKDANRNLSVNSDANTLIRFYFRSPAICFGEAGDKANIIRFGYDMLISEAVMNANMNGDNTVYNNQRFYSTTTLAAGTEKLLATYTKDHKINQNNGIPYLCDIPVLKYLVGAVSESTTHSRVFVTVKADPVDKGRNMSEWAGRVMELSQIPPAAAAK